MEMSTLEVEEKLGNLDLSLFENIESQTSNSDKSSLLALQNALRKRGKYTYLEIGSHLGGTIQPYFVDPLCTDIISIDKRTINIPDERGNDIIYEGNSTQRMLDNLKNISSGDINKIFCIDSDSENVDQGLIKIRPTLCFIDGEHTNIAVIKDFKLCFDLIKNKGIIVFHDVKVVYGGIREIMENLRSKGITFSHYFLPSSVYVIEFGDTTLKNDPLVAKIIRENPKGHLTLLKESFFYNRPKLSAFIMKVKSIFK